MSENTEYLLNGGRPGQGSMYLNKEKVTESKYSDVIKFIEKTGMKEQEVVKILEMYSQAPSQKAFDLVVKASKGDKLAIEALSKYIDGLKMISDE